MSTQISGDTGVSQIQDGAVSSSAKIAAGAVAASDLASSIPMVKAWARFNGATAGSNAPTAGSGISTITRNAAGNYTVAFSPALANTNYAANLVCSVAALATGVRVAAVKDGSLTVNGFDFYTFYAGTPTAGTDSSTDTMISVVA